MDTYTLTKNERKAAKAFKEKHAHNRRDGFRYELTRCEIGTVVKIRCNFCKEKKNVTDYDSW